MEPLASLNSATPPSPLVQPQQLLERDSKDSRAPNKPRDVVLRQDRVDGSESVRPHRATAGVASPDVPGDTAHSSGGGSSKEQPAGANPGADLKPPGETAREKLAERLEEKRAESQEAAESRESTGEGVSVRYRAKPHSPGGVQAQVVDRETDEVLRASPTDAAIELVEGLERHLGQNIDLLA